MKPGLPEGHFALIMRTSSEEQKFSAILSQKSAG